MAGDVSIAVLDPSKPGPAGKIARWDFKAAEAAKQFRKSGMGRGYSFEIPWPGDPPTSQKLQLFVRFTAPDGRLIQTDMPVTIAPPAPTRPVSGAACRRTRGPPSSCADFPRADFSRESADPQRWAGTNRTGQRMPAVAEWAAPFTAPPQIALAGGRRTGGRRIFSRSAAVVEQKPRVGPCVGPCCPSRSKPPGPPGPLIADGWPESAARLVNAVTGLGS